MKISFPRLFLRTLLLVLLVGLASACQRESRCDSQDSDFVAADSLLSQSRTLLGAGQPNEALAVLDVVDSCLAALPTSPTCPVLNTLCGRSAEGRAIIQHTLRQDSKETLDLYAKAIDCFRRSDRPDHIAMVYANMGDAYIALNDLPHGVAKYRRALVLADSLQLPSGDRVSIRLGLGRVYTMLRDFVPAQQCYEEARTQFDQLTPLMQAYFLTCYGNYFYYKQDYERACRVFLHLDSLLALQPKPDIPSQASCRLNLADVYLNLHDADRSTACLEQAEPFFRQWNDPTALFYIETIRLGLALERGDIAAAKACVEQEPDGADVDFNLREIRYRYVRNFYKHTGQWRKAYEMLQRERALTDSVFHNNEMLRTSVIISEMRYDTLRMRQQMTIAQKDVTLYRTQNIVVILVLAAVLMAVTIILLYMRYHHRETESQLALMQLRLVNLRNRVSPHFIFNVLNDKILKSDATQADQLSRLTVMLREGLDLAGQDVITLQEELDFINSYVEAERFEMGDDFLYSVRQVDGVDASAVKVPSMLVQILVENAIRHGLRGIDRPQRLTIEIGREGDSSTRITVMDNGRGFDARTQMSNHKHTGLAVVRQTVVVHNAHHRHKMHFRIHNQTDTEGRITGCHSTLIVPND